MSVIQQMQSASQITGRMVRQAMQEAQGDATQMKALEGICDKGLAAFDDVRTFDALLGFVQQYYQDRFEVRPNADNPAAKQALVTEARITKVVNTERTIDTTPPPPAPPRTWRDPLNISGSAEAGAKVEFYNASQPGRPVIGEMQADATGKFLFELTDETKFEYGDQIGVVVHDGSGKPSKPVVVPTEPFRIDNVKTTFTRRGSVVGETRTTSVRALDPNHDVRNPYLQNDKVNLKFTPPATADAPTMLELVGKDDATEPNSTLSVKVGNDVFTTKADDHGKFALKVYGFEPGQPLKLEVKDINGKGIDATYVAPEVELQVASLASAVERPPSPRQPADAGEVVGDGPPWTHFKAADVTVPNGAVMMRNMSTDEVYELKADDKGRINAAVGGITAFDVLEVVARDARGNISGDAELMVMLPEKVKRGAPFFMPANELTQKQPDVAKVIEAIKGPPQDIVLDGKVDPRGPYLRMPDVKGMPPFGQLAVMREGKAIQYLRADKDGVLQGMLRGVNVGDQLNFQVLDAAGRKFAVELAGWRVPGAGKTSEVPEKHVHTEDRPLADCLAQIGKGTLDLHDEWLSPFTIQSGAVAVPETNVPLHYRRQFFGDEKKGEKSEATFDYFPPKILEKLGIPVAANTSSGSLSLSKTEGTSRVTVGFDSAAQFTLGVDYVMGRVNLGSPNSPIEVPAHLENLRDGLKRTLAFVALAYDNGKEPGDMEYDRAMGAAKTFLYVFDRLAVEHPDHKDAIVDAAKAAIDKFPYELTSRFKVPASDAAGPGEPLARARSGAMSVLEARAAMLGGISGVGQVGQGEGGLEPPRVETAAVLVGHVENRHRGRVGVAPLRLTGSASPGDIVQVYNVSSGSKTLLAEAAAGADGRFTIVGNADDLRAGDQLGLVTVTSAGKKSAMSVVPTDAYELQHSNLRTARPLKIDDRPPFFRVGATKLENATFDAAGKARDGGPFWKLSGDELSVEPFSTVTLRTRTPDGKEHTTEAKVDGEGRFSLEFPHEPRSSFSVHVNDRNGNSSAVRMSTPGLAATAQTGDAANDAALGVVTFKMPSGEDVRGVIVAETIGRGDNDAVNIQNADRSDAFVDVVVNQQFGWTASNGQQQLRDYQVRVKIAKEDAAKFDVRPNESLNLLMPGFENVPVPGDNDGTEMYPVGMAKVLSRDYGTL